MTTKIDKDDFIEAFNDVDTYPTIDDVASHFGIKNTKVSQLANRFRKNGEAIINRRKKDHPVGGVEATNDETTSITFLIDDDLNVTTQTRVNLERVAQVLIDNDYISPDHRNDEFAVHLAFILMVNEVTTQIISKYTSES